MWAKQAERAASTNKYDEDTEATINALETLVGKRDNHNGRGNEATVYLGDYYPYRATAQGESVRFEAFSVPLVVALKVLPLLKEPK